MKIEITTHADAEDLEVLSQGIRRFNYTAVPDIERNEAEVKFCVLARNDMSEVTGGIRAICFWNTLHIELLWTDESCRGQGVGASLLASAESFARQNGCENVFVETTSWQAKPFYERHGYILKTSLKDRPKGHVSYYLAKNLTD